MAQVVKVDDRTHERLRVLAEQEGATMVAVVAKALDAYETQRFWAQARQAATALTAVELSEYQQEHAEWEQGTSRDGAESEHG